MRKGHFRKAQRQIGTLTQRISIAKGTANHKGDVAVAGKRQLIQLCRQIRAAQLLADDIQQNHIGVCRNNCQQALRFTLQHLLLSAGEGLSGIRSSLIASVSSLQKGVSLLLNSSIPAVRYFSLILPTQAIVIFNCRNPSELLPIPQFCFLSDRYA